MSRRKKILENKPRSYSQCVDNKSTDKILLDKYLNQKNVNGIFLELGATDGIQGSNTKMLEDYLIYTGILIEPGNEFFKQLQKNRKNTKNFNFLISDKIGKTKYIGDNTGVGGDLELLENTFDKNNRNWISAWNIDRKNIQEIECKKLGDLLKENNIEYIDFWSLDVEGGELEVLKTMDWNIPVYIICMEVSSWGDKGKHRVQLCRDILIKQGFELEMKYGLDELWINNSYFRKEILYK